MKTTSVLNSMLREINHYSQTMGGLHIDMENSFSPDIIERTQAQAVLDKYGERFFTEDIPEESLSQESFEVVVRYIFKTSRGHERTEPTEMMNRTQPNWSRRFKATLMEYKLRKNNEINNVDELRKTVFKGLGIPLDFMDTIYKK